MATNAAAVNNANNAAPKLSYADLLARVQQLEAEAAKPKQLSKISVVVNALGTKMRDGADAKGTLAVYGLGRMPVTLYASQWERLLSDEVQAEIKAQLEADKARPAGTKKLAYKD